MILAETDYGPWYGVFLPTGLYSLRLIVIPFDEKSYLIAGSIIQNLEMSMRFDKRIQVIHIVYARIITRYEPRFANVDSIAIMQSK